MDRGAPIALQQSFWNQWNTTREDGIDEVPRRQAEIVCRWLAALGRRNLDIVDVGCGAGWLCPQLTRFGRVTGTDLSDEVLARARSRAPDVTFVAGDFMALDLGRGAFDVVVTLEVLSHVADQQAFIGKLAEHLRPGGHLMLATQNRPVLEYLNSIPPPAPGQLRRWVDRRALRALLVPEFEVLELFAVTPVVGRGVRLGLGLRSSRLRRAGGAGLVRTAPTRVDSLSGAHPRPRWKAEAWLEAVGLGWTLMALARRRAAL